MEGRESGIVCLGNESRGRRGQERAAETKEAYGALTLETQTLLCFLALKCLCGQTEEFQDFQFKQEI